MKLEVKNETITAHKTPALIVGMFKNQFTPELKSVDNALQKELSAMIKSKEFLGDYGETKLLTTPSFSARKVLIVGLGKQNECTLEKLRRLAGKSAKQICSEKIKQFSTLLHTTKVKGTAEQKTQSVVEGTILGLYKFKKYITVDKDKICNVDSVTILVPDKKNIKVSNKAVKKGLILAKNVNYVRDLINEPAELITPSYLAKEASNLAKLSNKVKVRILSKADIVRMGMGGIEAVSRGGGHDPKLILIDYQGGKESPLALVGKGITFDSGGLDIKPYQYMEDMKSDMSGAATVIGTIKAAIELGLKKHIVGVIPACENMTGPRAYKQGDIVKSYNGKTIEIWHTDAEGRMVLADALSYAEKNFKPKAIIDVATLTGASIVALGYEITALLGTNEKLNNKVLNAAKKTGEMMWELPLYEDYMDLVKGDIGDLRNAPKESPGPGTITAGLFLQNFVEKTPWVHLDLGASAWVEKTKDYRYWGATGACLRTLIQLLEG